METERLTLSTERQSLRQELELARLRATELSTNLAARTTETAAIQERMNAIASPLRQEDSNLLAAWLGRLATQQQVNQERWEAIETALGRAAGTLLALGERVPKLKERFDKILILLQKTQRQGRKNVDSVAEFIQLAQSELDGDS